MAVRDLDSRRGMSLIELLVAVAISSLMFMAMMQVIYNGTKSLSVLKKRIEMAQQARVVLTRMTREIASAFHPYGMYGETSARTPKPWLVIQAAGVGGEEISFTGNLHQKDEFTSGATRNGDLTEIHYHVVSSGGQTYLYRRQEEGRLSAIATSYWTGGVDVMIAQNVRSLDFTAWDKDGNPAGGSGTYSYTGTELGFPSRIRIKVTFYDPDNMVDDHTFAVDVSTMRNNATYP